MDLTYEQFFFGLFMILVGLLMAYTVAFMMLASVRAERYRKRGYRVTWPSLLCLESRPTVEVPEGFVSDRPWLDENVLLFDRRARSDVR